MQRKITFSGVLFALFFLAFVPQTTLAFTPIPGTLSSNITLSSAGNPYILEYTVIAPGVTLTIEEGTVVKFSGKYSTLEVNGKLVVNGTETNPAYFTSINDNAVSGTTGNGAPQQGDWGNIMIKEGGTAEINHAVIRYGGYTGWLTATASSNLYNRGGTLSLTNSLIGNSWSGLTHASGTTTLERNTLSENGKGILVNGTGSISLARNTFSNNTESAAYLDLSGGIDFVHSENTATGGSQSGFHLRGVLNSDYVFGKDTMPYIIGYLEIPFGKTMTARPGTVFKFENTGSQARISGTLRAEGTEAEPIYFTSIKDDTVLGDTNGDGNATSPQATDWAEIFVLNGGAANFNHSVIRYGGQHSWGIWTNSSNISNSGGTLDIANSEISYGNIGVYHR
ncbi:MAG: hypothetical protein Q8O19_03005, partial [Rectinemataceae bacterium]|nr:hypothetical protein [Rectinemataceae bacterium]